VSIYIVSAVCARCGRPLKVSADAVTEPYSDGNLYLKLDADGTFEARAICKNVTVCRENHKQGDP
jgi:hypothetical protein